MTEVMQQRREAEWERGRSATISAPLRAAYCAADEQGAVPEQLTKLLEALRMQSEAE